MHIIVNGSFVTDICEPNDVDRALRVGPDYRNDPNSDKEMHDGLPFIEAELLTQVAFDYYVNTLFGSDRFGVPKGLIEVLP